MKYEVIVSEEYRFILESDKTNRNDLQKEAEEDWIIKNRRKIKDQLDHDTFIEVVSFEDLDLEKENK